MLCLWSNFYVNSVFGVRVISSFGNEGFEQKLEKKFGAFHFMSYWR